jgi:hypothetical protein
LTSIYKNYCDRNNHFISKEDARKRILEFIIDIDFGEINDKPRIILVSKEFRQEVTASVMWLRNYGLDIKCIKLTPYQLSHDKIVIEVNTIIPIPEAEDYIIRTEQKENQEGKMTVGKEEYLTFHKEIIRRLRTRISKPFKDPEPRSYYQIPTGITGLHFEWGFHGRPRHSFGVELHAESSDNNSNKENIKRLAGLKSSIESKTSEKLIIQEVWGQKWARLYIEFPYGEITEQLKTWAVDKMEVFIKTLQPEIDKFRL